MLISGIIRNSIKTVKKQNLPTPKDIISRSADIVLQKIIEDLNDHCTELSFENIRVTTWGLPKATNARVVASLAKRGWTCRIQRVDKWRQRFVIAPRDGNIFRAR